MVGIISIFTDTEGLGGKTLANHDSLLKPSSIIVLSFFYLSFFLQLFSHVLRC